MRSVSKVRSLANVRCDLCYCYHRPGQVRHLLSELPKPASAQHPNPRLAFEQPQAPEEQRQGIHVENRVGRGEGGYLRQCGLREEAGVMGGNVVSLARLQKEPSSSSPLLSKPSVPFTTRPADAAGATTCPASAPAPTPASVLAVTATIVSPIATIAVPMATGLPSVVVAIPAHAVFRHLFLQGVLPPQQAQRFFEAGERRGGIEIWAKAENEWMSDCIRRACLQSVHPSIHRFIDSSIHRSIHPLMNHSQTTARMTAALMMHSLPCALTALGRQPKRNSLRGRQRWARLGRGLLPPTHDAPPGR